jgi:hypothetical protein
MKDSIELEVRKTLDSFEHTDRLKTDPWFYSRLKARMNAEQASPKSSNIWGIVQHALKPALLISLVAANIFIATQVLIGDRQAVTHQEDAIVLFAREFSLDSHQYNPTFIMNEQD